MGKMIQGHFKLVFLGVLFISVNASEAATFSPCQTTLSKLSDWHWVNYFEEPSVANHEALLRHFKPLVLFFASNYAKRVPFGVEVDDLFQEGWLALSNELRRFDPTRGVKFESFVSRRVRGAMLDFIRNNDPLVRRIRERDKIVRDTKEELRKEMGREALDEEVLAELQQKHSQSEAQKIWDDHRSAIQLTSLDALAKSAEGPSNLRGNTLAEILADQSANPPELELEREESWSALSKLISPNAATAMRLIFIEGLSQSDAAIRMGFDPSRVSQLMTEVREVFKSVGEAGIRAILNGEAAPETMNENSIRGETRSEEQLKALNDFILGNKRWPSASSNDPKEAGLGRWVNNHGSRVKVFELLREEVKLVAPKNWRNRAKEE